MEYLRETWYGFEDRTADYLLYHWDASGRYKQKATTL